MQFLSLVSVSTCTHFLTQHVSISNRYILSIFWSYCLNCVGLLTNTSIYVNLYINASGLVILEAKLSVLPHTANPQKTSHCVDQE